MLWKEGESILLLDGGFATELERQGADLTGHLWSARLLQEDPSLIKATHALYYQSGADIGITASYQATFAGFQKIGLTKDQGKDMLRTSVTLARAARDEVWEDWQKTCASSRRRPLVAASVGCFGASLADGSEYTGHYNLTVAELKEFHRERILVLAEEKPDVFACETVPCLAEVEALLELLQDPAVQSCGIPAWISVSIQDSEHLNSGESITSLTELVASKPSPLLAAVGVNCSSPHQVGGALTAMSSRLSMPLVVYANTGEGWDGVNKCWKPGTAVDDDTFSDLALEWAQAGARIIGGCCRTTPATIQALRHKLIPNSSS